MKLNQSENSGTDKFLSKAVLLYNSKTLLGIIIIGGGVLRLAQYLFNRSLWYDESMLALNIISRTFAELIRPLSFEQSAPIGFLMVEKLLVHLFGNSEYTLRLFPLICGVASLPLFYKVTTHYIGPKVLPIALGLFAISGPLIYYSSEVKQYSSDVTITLVLFLIAIHIKSKGLTVSRIVIFSIAGAVALWFSHPAIFILAGVGFSMALIGLVKKQWSWIGPLLVVGSIWVLSFAFYYVVSLREASQNRYLLDFHKASFMPFPPRSISDAQWFAKTFFSFFKVPGGFPLHNVAALTFLIGLVLMYREKREVFYVFLSPLVFVLLASGLHRYPLYERFMLFMVPFALLIIAAGIEQIMAKTPRIISTILIGLLVLPPLSLAGYNLVKPRTVEEMKPCMNFLRDHWQDGDLLYLYCGSVPAFQYYSGDYGFQNSPYILGVTSRQDWSKYIEDVDKLRGHKRIWMLFSNSSWWEGVDEKKVYLAFLDCIGTRIYSFEVTGSAVYLYDL